MIKREKGQHKTNNNSILGTAIVSVCYKSHSNSNFWNSYALANVKGSPAYNICSIWFTTKPRIVWGLKTSWCIRYKDLEIFKTVGAEC